MAANAKSLTDGRPCGLREPERARAVAASTSAGSSIRPNSLFKYAGGLEEARTPDGLRGLLERGEVKVRSGRAFGVVTICGEPESELDVEMTDAFLLRSASVGGNVSSGDGSSLGMKARFKNEN